MPRMVVNPTFFVCWKFNTPPCLNDNDIVTNFKNANHNTLVLILILMAYNNSILSDRNCTIVVISLQKGRVKLFEKL